MGWLVVRAGWLALVFLVVLAAPAAAADDVEALMRQGIEFRREGKEREALEAFNKAAAIQKTPRVLAQIALAEQALGLWVGAEAHLKEALAASSDPWIQKNLAALTSARDVIAGHVGRLDLWGEPAGAEVLLDGEAAGVLPLGPVSVAVGTVTVTVRARGFAELSRSLEIPKGTLVRERIKLRSLSVSAEASESALAAGSAGATASPADATLVQSPGTASGSTGARPIYKKWWFWTIVGAAAVGAGATALILTSGDQGLTCDPNIPCGIW